MKSKVSFVEVHLDALVHNYNIICQNAGNQRVAAVIKGNAYGLGKEEVFDALMSASCSEFFVADWQEALDLDRKNAKIYALSGAAPDEQQLVASLGIVPVFYRMEEALSWYNLYGNSRECALHIETGLNRLGFLREEVLQLSKLLKVSFLLNHFACGYTENDELNERQARLAVQLSDETGVPLSIGSSCIFNMPRELLQKSCLVRTGRYLYGIRSNLSKDSAIFGKILPVGKVFTSLIECKKVAKGEQVGYDKAFIAPEDMEIGILNIGYSSGCILTPGKNKVFSNGAFFEVISQPMDYTMVDLAGKRVEIGDEFEIFGDNIEQFNHGVRIIVPSMMVERRYLGVSARARERV